MKLTVTKKLVLSALAAFILGTTANAQIQFGLKAGANIAKFTGDDASGFNSQVGFLGGAFVSIPLAGRLSFQPEAVYSGQGAKGTESGSDFNVHCNYINIPLLLKYTSSVGLYGETGPQIGFLTTAKVKSGGVSVDDKSDFKSTDFSWAFGIGYLSTANIGIDARYNLGLSNIEASNGGSTTGSLKNAVFQIGLFYVFGDSGKK
jgi:hypothetical protein